MPERRLSRSETSCGATHCGDRSLIFKLLHVLVAFPPLHLFFLRVQRSLRSRHIPRVEPFRGRPQVDGSVHGTGRQSVLPMRLSVADEFQVTYPRLVRFENRGEHWPRNGSYVPDPHDAVRGPGGQEGTVRREVQRPNRLAVSSKSNVAGHVCFAGPAVRNIEPEPAGTVLVANGHSFFIEGMRSNAEHGGSVCPRKAATQRRTAA